MVRRLGHYQGSMTWYLGEWFWAVDHPERSLTGQGLNRAVQLAEAWNIPLQMRPVLPMVMHGQSVPDAKKWYIFHDTKREANKLGIPYGFVADPLGPGGNGQK